MNLLLCDDHTLFAEALAGLLVARGHLVTAIVHDPEAAVEAAVRNRVDVCVMDLHFPGGTSVAAIAQLVELEPPPVVVVLTGMDGDDALADAVAAGAMGIARKSDAVEHVASVLERVAAGEAVLPMAVLRQAVNPRPQDSKLLGARFLTEREHEVLTAIVAGESTPRIAERLGVAYSTARSHVQSVITKLGAHSKLEAAAIALSNGLVPIPGTAASRT